MRIGWLPFAAAALLAPALASAQARDPATAELLFTEGRKAADKGDYASDCRKFAESQRLDPAPGTVLNLADCEEHAGKLASAWQHYQQAAQQFDPKDERQAYAAQKAAALEARVPRLTLTLAPGAPEGTRVARDGVELGAASMGLPLPVEPGSHTVVVAAPGRDVVRVEVTLKEGQSVARELSAGAAAAQGRAAPLAPAAGPAAPAPTDGSGLRTVGFVVGGVGVASLVVGAVTGGLALGNKGAVEEHCEGAVCDQEGVDASEAGRAVATVSTATFIVGAVGVGAGLALVLAAGGGKDEKRPATAIGTAALRGGGGVWLTHAF